MDIVATAPRAVFENIPCAGRHGFGFKVQGFGFRVQGFRV